MQALACELALPDHVVPSSIHITLRVERDKPQQDLGLRNSRKPMYR